MLETITVRIGEGRTGKVKAFPTGIKGLVIRNATEGPPGWYLTHVRSGYAIGYFRPEVDPEAVLACAQELGAAIDWTQSATALQEVPGLMTEVLVAVLRHGGFNPLAGRPRDLGDVPA